MDITTGFGTTMTDAAYAQPVVSLTGIGKYFGEIKANDDISLDIHAGRIKALLGENGAGKSTLMSILSGKLLPDKGRIEVDGRPVSLTSPKDALRLGIGMVYQHFTLVESMTVAENIALGQVKGFFLSRRKMEDAVAGITEKYGLALEPRALVHTLSMGEKQRVEIAKLLMRQSRVLIFDEPTAVLTPLEAEQLFISMRAMAGSGKAIVFISHKMQEVLDVSDEIAILRRGRIVDEFSKADVPCKSELANRMLGRELDEFKAPGRSLTVEGETVLKVDGLSGPGLDSVSLSVRKGEILAVVGVSGNGQKELADTLSGLLTLKDGSVSIQGTAWRDFYPSLPRKGGLAYIPEDRLRRSVCPELSLAGNFLLTTRGQFSHGPWLRRKKARAKTDAVLEEFDVLPRNRNALAKSLSGGNLQKFVIGRELSRCPEVIVAENPTQGLDVAATEEVWSRLLKARESAGVLLVTGDLTEALALADRIAVMFKGKIMDAFDRADEEKVSRIGLLMAGISSADGNEGVKPGIE